MFKNSLKLITGTILVATLSYAEDAVDIGKWWEGNSYMHPQTSDFLYHFEGELGYEKEEGNIDSLSYGYKLSAMIRKEHLSSSVFYNGTKSDMTMYADKNDKKGTVIKSQDYDRGITLDYDFSSNIFAELGYTNSKNTDFDIYNQTRIYGGLGYDITILESHSLSLFVAKGTEDTSYGIFPQYPGGKTDAYLIILDYSWEINEAMSFATSYEKFVAEKNYRDSSAFNATFSVGLSESTFMSVSYTDKYNEMQETVKKYPHIKTMSTSIGFSF